MNIGVRPLRDLDDARRVADLVYEAYGLTYHRAFLYEPRELLHLNASGNLHSWLAFSGDQLVGHLATIRPWFEIEEPGAEPPVLEVGLSIVARASRHQGVQTELSRVALRGTAERNEHFRGIYMKCVTTHTSSQQTAQHFGGRATALFPAGVPALVRNAPGAPTTTILLHAPYGDHPMRTLHAAPEHAPMLAEIYAGLSVRRELHLVRGAAAPREGTRLRHWFDPARRQGLVWVKSAGADVVERVRAEVEWLRKGEMEHVTVLLPLDSPWAALSAPMIEELGLFCGGVIPDLGGVDTLVLQQVVATEEQLGRIEVVGPDAARLKEQVLAAWRRAAEWNAPLNIRPITPEHALAAV
jgi:hypothetical protein